MVYLAAYVTALRVAELEKLRWADLNLDASVPHVRVRASTTKNHRSANIPLGSRLTAELRKMKASADLDRPVFNFTWRYMKKFRKDLQSSGIASGPDELGRELVFHSLRHSHSTHLLDANVPARVVQESMRHSDIRLTTHTYTDVKQLSSGQVTESLSRIVGVERVTQVTLTEHETFWSRLDGVGALRPEGWTEEDGYGYLIGQLPGLEGDTKGTQGDTDLVTRVTQRLSVQFQGMIDKLSAMFVLRQDVCADVEPERMRHLRTRT